MDALNHFSIPIKGLKDGVHHFTFRIEADFFKHYEASPIENGNFEVQLEFDKRPEFFVLDFHIQGKIQTACDRCLADIQLPIQDDQQIIVKKGATVKDEAEVVFISRDAHELNVANMIYENICLATPLIKTYDCESEEPSVCDQSMLKFLEQENTSSDNNNPIWDQLNNLK